MWNTGIRLGNYKPSSITSKVWLALMHGPTYGSSQVWMRTRSRSPFTPCLVTATYCPLVRRRSRSFPSIPRLCLLLRFPHYLHLPSLRVARHPPFSLGQRQRCRQGQHRSQDCDPVDSAGTCTAALFRMLGYSVSIRSTRMMRVITRTANATYARLTTCVFRKYGA